MFSYLVLAAFVATAISAIQVFPEGRMTKYDYNVEVQLSVNKINYWTAAKLDSLLEVHNKSGIMTTLIKDLQLNMLQDQILTPHRRDEQIMPMMFYPISGELIDTVREQMQRPTSFRMSQGHAESLTFAGEVNIAKNLKRGLIQLLQAPPSLLKELVPGQTERRYEATVLGICEAVYLTTQCKTSSQCYEILKTINLKKCIGTPLPYSIEMEPIYQQMKNDSKNELFSVKYVVHKEQAEAVIERITAYSVLYNTPTMKRDGPVTVQFIQTLHRRSSEVSQRAAATNVTAPAGLDMIAEIPLTHESMLAPTQFVAKIDELIKGFNKTKSNPAYLVNEIKNLLRTATPEKIDLLLNKYERDIETWELLWDILPAVANEAIKKVIYRINIDMLIKKPLILTVFAEHQTFDPETLDLMKKLTGQIRESHKILRDTAFMALSIYSHKCVQICQVLEAKYEQESGLLKSTDSTKVPREAKMILEKLQEKISQHRQIRKQNLEFFKLAMKGVVAKEISVRLLKNLGDPNSLPVLVDLIQNDRDMTIRVAAADALMAMPLESLVDYETSALVKLYMTAKTPDSLRIRIFKALIANTLNDNMWELLVSSIRFEPNCYVAKWTYQYISQIAQSEFKPMTLWTVKARKALDLWPVSASPCWDTEKSIIDIYEILKERVWYPLHVSKYLESLRESLALDIQLLPVTDTVFSVLLRGRIFSQMISHDYAALETLKSTKVWLMKDSQTLFVLNKDVLQARPNLAQWLQVFIATKEIQVPTSIGSLLHLESSLVLAPRLHVSIRDVIELANPAWFSYWESRGYIDGTYMKPGVGVYEEIKAAIPGTLRINLSDKSIALIPENNSLPILDIYKSFYNFVEFEPTQKLVNGFIPRLIQDDFVQPDSRILACAMSLGPFHLSGLSPDTWKHPLNAIISMIHGIQHQRLFAELEKILRIAKAEASLKPCPNMMHGRMVSVALLEKDGSKIIGLNGGVCWLIDQTKIDVELQADLLRKDAEKKQFKTIIKVPLMANAPWPCIWNKDYQQQVKEQLSNVSAQNLKMLPYLMPHWQSRMTYELNYITQYDPVRPDAKVTFLETPKENLFIITQGKLIEKVEQQRSSITSLSVRKLLIELVKEVIQYNEQVIKYVSEPINVNSEDLELRVKYFHERNSIINRQFFIWKRIEEMFRAVKLTITPEESALKETLKKELLALQSIFVKKVSEHIQIISPLLLKKLPAERKAIYQNALLIENLYLEITPRNINETSMNISKRLELLLKELPQLFDYDSVETELLLLELYRVKFYPTILLNETLCEVNCNFQSIMLKSWQLQQDIVIYERLLHEIQYYKLSCDKMSASCFSLNMKYMVQRLIHDFMDYKRSTWENVIEENPQKLISSYQQLYQTLAVAVKLIQMREPSLLSLVTDGGLPLYIELNEFLTKLHQISLYIVNEPVSDWHTVLTQKTDMEKKHLKKSIISLFEKLQRVTRIQSSKFVKSQLNTTSSCNIPKSAKAEVTIEVDKTPILTVAADFQKTLEQLKKESELQMLYWVPEQRNQHPYQHILEELSRGLNSFKSAWITIDWQNERMSQPVVTVLGHLRDWVQYLLRDYLVVMDAPETSANVIEIGVQQVMNTNMVNLRVHIGSKIYLIKSIPVPIDLFISPPSYKSIMSGVHVLRSTSSKAWSMATLDTLKSSKYWSQAVSAIDTLKSSKWWATALTTVNSWRNSEWGKWAESKVSTVNKWLPWTEIESLKSREWSPVSKVEILKNGAPWTVIVPTAESRIESGSETIHRRHVRDTEDLFVPTIESYITTTADSLLSNIIRKTVTPPSTMATIADDSSETTGPEWKVTIPLKWPVTWSKVLKVLSETTEKTLKTPWTSNDLSRIVRKGIEIFRSSTEWPTTTTWEDITAEWKVQSREGEITTPLVERRRNVVTTQSSHRVVKQGEYTTTYPYESE
ncbi:uncharacterized protein LOC115215599 [Argonauta hians]